MRIERSVEIRAPARIVFDVVSTPERLPRWNVSVLSARRAADERVALGSRATVTGRLLGHEIVSETEVVEFDAPRRFATRAVRGPRLNLRCSLEQAPFGTRLEITLEGELPGGRLAEKLAQPILTADFERSLERLRALCEGEAKSQASKEPLEGSDPACWLGVLPDADSSS